MRRFRHEAGRIAAAARKDRGAPQPEASSLTREWEVEATLENLPRLRAFVDEECRAAGGDARSCGDLKLAVDEACTNVIEHGYAGKPGTIRLSAAESGGRLTVVVEDRGRAFDPRGVAAPDLSDDWENRRIGGLGWHLIRSCVDEIRYEPGEDGGNRLTLIKTIHPEEDRERKV
ncbi:MAG TPA: ATP-binding protein [Thermoanaerobaculia bacterium]